MVGVCHCRPGTAEGHGHHSRDRSETGCQRTHLIGLATETSENDA